MSRVQFVRGTVLGTGVVAEVGDVVECEEGAANLFVRQERAVFVDGEELPPDPGLITVEDTPKPKASRTR